MNKKILAIAIMTLTFSSGAFAHGECGSTELHGYMVNIKDELRLMSSHVKSGDNDAAVTSLHSIIDFFEKSRNTLPYKFTSENLQDDELVKQKSLYLKTIDETIEVFNSLEVALVSGNSTEIKTLFGKIGKQRNIGHRTFKTNC